MKITSDIYQVGGSAISHPSDASSYLIVSGNQAALIDSGTGSGIKNIISNIKNICGDLKNVKYLFLTHCHYDHIGGAENIREATGCSIAAHILDAEFIERGDSDVTAASWYGKSAKPVKVDIKIKEKTRKFAIGNIEIEFIHTPGHSPGSSVLTAFSDGKKVLFGQDIHGPLDSTLLSDRKKYRDSLEFLLSLDADILCEGHFGIYSGKDKVKEFIRSYI